MIRKRENRRSESMLDQASGMDARLFSSPLKAPV
jgi:hypothetical protein